MERLAELHVQILAALLIEVWKRGPETMAEETAGSRLASLKKTTVLDAVGAYQNKPVEEIEFEIITSIPELFNPSTSPTGVERSFWNHL